MHLFKTLATLTSCTAYERQVKSLAYWIDEIHACKQNALTAPRKILLPAGTSRDLASCVAVHSFCSLADDICDSRSSMLHTMT